MLTAAPRFVHRVDSAKVAHVTPTISFTICIYDFTVITGFWYADVISITNHRSGIYDENNHFALLRLPHPGNNTVLGIVKIDPFESVEGIVQIPQGRLALI